MPYDLQSLECSFGSQGGEPPHFAPKSFFAAPILPCASNAGTSLQKSGKEVG